MEPVTIGLDIGSSAVRAAELHVGKDGRRKLVRYAQVGLSPGHVVDGEIHDVRHVADALRRLWIEGGFSSTNVVLGVSGPRVFVRQADVAPLSAEELRSSLKFDAQEMIPIPMEDASFDFSMLGSAQAGEEGRKMQRILLVAAHKDLLSTYMTTLREAGLTPAVMDASPLALMRAVPDKTADEVAGAEVIVSIGAELTTVAVRHSGVPRFIRSLTIGGGKLTEMIASRMHLELAVAERLKRGAASADLPQVAQARKAMGPEVRELAEEVRATIDFFVSQSGGTEIDRLVITGGAAQTEDLALSIAGNLPVQVVTLDPLATLDLSELQLDRSEISRISAGAATAIGLSLWHSESPLIRLSVLPDEVAQAQRARKHMTLAGTALAGLAGVLAIVAGVQFLAVHSEESKVHTEDNQVSSLTAQVNGLQKVTYVHGQMESQGKVVASTLKGDVDWVRVLGQMAAVMPQDVSLSSFSGNRSSLVGATSSASTAGSSIGTLTFSVAGTGGLPAAAAWLDELATDPDMSNVTISGITVKSNGGAVQFSSTAGLTPTSESTRAKEVNQ